MGNNNHEFILMEDRPVWCCRKCGKCFKFEKNKKKEAQAVKKAGKCLGSWERNALKMVYGITLLNDNDIEILTIKRVRDEMLNTPEGRIEDILVAFNNNTHLAIRLLHNGKNARVSCKFITKTDLAFPAI
jgi:hypothetical protein